MAENENGLRINGKLYNADSLTFRELRQARDLVRSLVGDTSVSITDVDLMDFAPVLVYIIEHRDDPDFTLDQALDMRWDEVEDDEAEQAGPPTNGAEAPKKTAARSGSRR